MGKLGKEKAQLKKDKSISHLDHCLEFLKKWNQEYRPDLGSFLKDGTGLILKFILKIKIRDNRPCVAVNPAVKEWSKKDKNTFIALAQKL